MFPIRPEGRDPGDDSETMPERFEPLAVYNGGMARGVQYPPFVHMAMSGLQRDFDLWRRDRFVAEHPGCTVVETAEGGLLSLPPSVELSLDAPAGWKVVYRP